MSVELNRIVPWGRSMDEYCLMFGLDESKLSDRILGCGDGPASFNAEMTAHSRNVVSCDPIYSHSAEEIRSQFYSTVENIITQVCQNSGNYIWSYHRDPAELRRNREAVMKRFVADFPRGCREGRYVNAALPHLPFRDQTFGLAVCSHLLFLYSKLLSEAFHLASIKELCRVAAEVRIFPLVGLDCEPSPHVLPIVEKLRREGYVVEIIPAKYQLQRNGNQMMRVMQSISLIDR